MADSNLVVKIGNKYFESRIGFAMIMSYIVFKRPLEMENIGESLNQQILKQQEHPNDTKVKAEQEETKINLKLLRGSKSELNNMEQINMVIRDVRRIIRSHTPTSK